MWHRFETWVVIIAIGIDRIELNCVFAIVLTDCSDAALVSADNLITQAVTNATQHI